jgi:type IV pilus assembly protein PilV
MSSPRETGSVLLEGLIAILIFSFGILAIVGLRANSMRISTDAKMRIDASNIANQRVGEMWVDATNLSAHAKADESVPSLPDGKMTTVVAGDVVTITITWKLPGESSTQQFNSTTRINANPVL